MNIIIVDILKVALSGLVFLFTYLGYRLLTIEQKKDEPNSQNLKTISIFIQQAMIMAVIVGGFTIWETYHKTNMNEGGIDLEQIKECRSELETLEIQADNPDLTKDELKQNVKNRVKSCLSILEDSN